MEKDIRTFKMIPLDDLKNIQSIPLDNHPVSHAEDSEDKQLISEMISRIKAFTKLNTPLIPLKFALFFWWGCGAIISTFVFVYFKQLGLTMAEISVIGIVAPIFQFLGPIVSGIVSDKTGKTKPVLVVNIILLLLSLNCMLFIPSVQYNPEYDEVKIKCNETDEQNHNSSTRNHSLSRCAFECDRNITLVKLEVICSSRDSYNCEVQINDQGQFRTLFNICKKHDYQKTSLVLNESVLPTMSSPHSLFCKPKCNISSSTINIKENSTLVFVLSFILLICFFTAASNIYGTLEVTAMYLASAHNSDFGRERFWSILSLLVLSPLAGYLVQVTSPVDGPPNYENAFYFSDVLVLFLIISTWKLDITVKPPSDKMLKKTRMLLNNVDMLCLILAILILGTSWGFKDTFTNLYLTELGAPPLLLSLVSAVTGLLGLPFLLTSDWWIRKLGSNNIVLCSFASYTLGFIGYSYLVDSWWSLMCESMTIFTYHLMWTAVARHMYDVAPEGLSATAIISAGNIHYLVGKGTGNLIGGFIMSSYGGRVAFRVIAAMCVVSAGLYGTFLLFRRKHRTK